MPIKKVNRSQMIVVGCQGGILARQCALYMDILSACKQSSLKHDWSTLTTNGLQMGARTNPIQIHVPFNRLCICIYLSIDIAITSTLFPVVSRISCQPSSYKSTFPTMFTTGKIALNMNRAANDMKI